MSSTVGGGVVMATQRFRLKTRTLALVLEDGGKQVALEIPAGAEIHVTDPVPLSPVTDHTERILIRWNDRTASLFLVDLQERGQRIGH